MQCRDPGFCVIGETFNYDTFSAGCLVIIVVRIEHLPNSSERFNNQELLVRVAEFKVSVAGNPCDIQRFQCGKSR
jgi:hypothetical protein